MGYNHQRIKENAKTHYAQNKWNNVVVALLVSIATGLSSGGNSFNYRMNAEDFSGGEAAAIAGVTMIIGLIGIALSVFIIPVVTMGGMNWYRKAIYSQGLDVGSMFESFKVKYWDNVLTMFLKNLFISLWTMLFIVPGIVMGYAYGMTEFIKMENPNIQPMRAIELSKAMTKGHKGDLFYLDLSFFGWFLLSALTLGILGIVYVNPYYFAAKAFAYEELKADAIANGKLDPNELAYNPGM